MQFAKYHGAGNDFLVVDLRTADPADAAAIQAPRNVIALCDRQFGVGGDGVLAILPSATADARMRVLNSDGSEAEMCGNGIRCVAKHLHDRNPALRRPTIRIETGAGVLACDVSTGDDGLVRRVAVAMGRPRLTRAEIPMTGPADERALEVPLDDLKITAVSMGNPHAVAFVDERGDALRAR